MTGFSVFGQPSLYPLLGHWGISAPGSALPYRKGPSVLIFAKLLMKELGCHITVNDQVQSSDPMYEHR